MKKFKSTSGQPVRIAMTDGHVAIVGTEWADLHERFHTQAYANGCISEDMIKNTSQDALDPKVVNTLNNIALQKNELQDVMRKMVADNELEAFAANGKPKSNILTERVGFRVTNAMRDEAWYKVQETLNDSD